MVLQLLHKTHSFRSLQNRSQVTSSGTRLSIYYLPNKIDIRVRKQGEIIIYIGMTADVVLLD